MVKGTHCPAYSDNNSKVFIEPISEANSKCMISYIIPTVQPKSEVTVIHCRKNKLPYCYIVAIKLSTGKHLLWLTSIS